MEIQLWKEILSPYEQAVDELLVKFNHIIMQYKSMGKYSPIESVTGRVKTVSSIIDKLQKKNIPMDRIVEEMDDIAGSCASSPRISARWLRLYVADRT